jgi:hypothetical protein
MKTTFLIGMSLIATILISSCKKEYELMEINEELALIKDSTSIETIDEPLGQSVANDDEFFGEESTLKAGYNSGILDKVSRASSYKDIPNYAFRCYTNYKWGYRHLRQPDNSSCSWTSYVICTGNIASISGRSYPVSVSQVYKVKAGCGNSSYIQDLAFYGMIKDRKYVRSRVVSFSKKNTSYFSIMKEMMKLMETNKTPFLAIAKSGSKAHYLIVYSIHWKQGLTGSRIYYMDPLAYDKGSFDKNIRSMDLYEFVHLMKTNSNIYYNFLELLPVWRKTWGEASFSPNLHCHSIVWKENYFE